MEKKSRINWWIVAAVIVIGVPVGYVASGVVKQLVSRNLSTETDSTEIVSLSNPVEKADTVAITAPAEETLAKLETAEPKVIVAPKPNNKVELTPEERDRQRQIAEERMQLLEQKRIQDQERKQQLDEERKRQDEIKKKQEQERQEQDRLKKEEEARKRAEAEAKLKAEAEAKMKREAEVKRNQVSSAVVSGKRDALVPAHCTIVVNGISMDYQNFCVGVRTKAYSNVKVKNVNFDSDGNANKVVVSAKVNQDE